MSCQFVPPYLLRHVVEARPDVGPHVRSTLEIDEQLRASRTSRPSARPTVAVGAEAPAWTVHTAENGTSLPGTPVRAAGEPAVGDAAVDEAAVGIEGSLALFAEVYQRRSYDGAGIPVSLTVHYGQDYDNAFWDGTQLVFGDGDGTVFERFTRPVDVLGHEFTHAVTEHTAGLVYEGQSGALNESVSDVFASCLKQRLKDQTALEADWLIGQGLFVEGIQARGLRDMMAPGTAYDDPALGKDPQGGHMDDYIETTDDNGGVHLNSGIPNRAFALAATGIGGRSWEGAGAIWYAALTGGQVDARSDFAAFAGATIAAAGEHADVVREAWETVGVVPASLAGAGAGAGTAVDAGGAGAGVDAGVDRVSEAGALTSPAQVVRVRRTGGFAGLSADGEVDLEADDPLRDEVRSLVERIDLSAVHAERPRPDMYVYDFELLGSRAVVPEPQLSPELRRLAELLLGRGQGGQRS